MSYGWRPMVVGGAVVVVTFVLAQAQVFAPSAPAETGTPADPVRGAEIFAGECSGCHGNGGTGGVGPALVGSGLDPAQVATVVQQGRGVMPAGIVSGQDRADVVAYVVSVSRPPG